MTNDEMTNDLATNDRELDLWREQWSNVAPLSPEFQRQVKKESRSSTAASGSAICWRWQAWY